MLNFPFSLRCSVAASLRGETPGAARQPLTFFVSPKKVSKERRPQSRCPFGVPGKVSVRTGNETNSPLLRKDSDMFRFLSVLPPTFPAASTAEKAKAKPLRIGVFGLAQIFEYPSKFLLLHWKALRKVVPRVFAGPAVDAAEVRASKADKKRNMFESLRSKGELVSFPALGVLASGTRRAAALRSPFFAYFLWRDKESERLPGRPRRATTERSRNRASKREL